MPVAMNRNMKATKNIGRFSACTDQSAPTAPTASVMKLTAVMRAPPIRSDSLPPNGRAIEPMPAPRKAYVNAMSPRSNTALSNVGNAAEYPMNEPKVPM